MNSRPRKTKRIVLSALGPTSEEKYRDALDVIGLMRRHRRSLASASREIGIAPETVKRYVASALTKRRGRYRTTEFDRLPRTMYLYDTKGRFTVTTRSSKAASRISAYHRALSAYVNYGDPSRLREFEDETITVGGVNYTFLTDIRTIDGLIRAQEIAVHDIYATAR